MKKILFFLLLGFFTISCSKDDTDDQPIQDDFKCTTPTSLHVSNINFESANLDWNSSNYTGFILEYGESGFSEGTAEVISLNSSSYKAENLKANTTYEFFVKAICIDGATTEPSARKSFSTDICPISEISDIVSITETSALVRWMPFYDNYQLEYGLHGFVPGSGTVINLSYADVTLSGLTPGTQYDVYLRTNCNGDFSDYSNVHTFETIPICFEPTDLIGTNITSNSVRINWNPKGETSWQIQYGVVGFQLGTGTTINTSNRPYTIQNLNNNTTYEFYIRANCGSDGFSKWSESLVITTEYY